jgi:hypothetical protein
VGVRAAIRARTAATTLASTVHRPRREPPLRRERSARAPHRSGGRIGPRAIARAPDHGVDRRLPCHGRSEVPLGECRRHQQGQIGRRDRTHADTTHQPDQEYLCQVALPTTAECGSEAVRSNPEHAVAHASLPWRVGFPTGANLHETAVFQRFGPSLVGSGPGTKGGSIRPGFVPASDPERPLCLPPSRRGRAGALP